MKKVKNEKNIEIGKRIVKARKRKGLGQIEFAKLIPMRQQSLHAIETGLNGTKLLARIAELLNVSEEWLRFGINPPAWEIEPNNQTIKLAPGLEITYLEEHIKGRKLFAIKITDHAMILHNNAEKSLEPGQHALIEENIKPSHGDIVLAKPKNEQRIIFREYQIDGENVYLYAFNPDKARYPSISIENIEKIIGVKRHHGYGSFEAKTPELEK